MTTILKKNNGLDKVSSTDVRHRYTEMARIVRASRKPVEITVNGKADLIIMNPELFEGLMDILEEYEDELAVLKYDNRKNDVEFISSAGVFKDVALGEFEDISIDDLLNQ